jgi:Helix-turn-helix domain
MPFGKGGSKARCGYFSKDSALADFAYGDKMNTKSQNEEILAHLKKGRSISPIEALERFGCMRLGGRIYELKKQGHQIETVMVQQNGKRYAEYRLAR